MYPTIINILTLLINILLHIFKRKLILNKQFSFADPYNDSYIELY